ncbi:hypothetical protein [uncultured Polaribacter sp.]|uniref:hypothetical protein n=1 Tax=uncultured Polaribacter sp. TaxID=174711 RepID=UPI00260A2251|nr:hypothetical protein [uncultured Polaribacter sp.]
MINELPKLKELLETEIFRTKTSMFIGEKKISLLKSFFDGFYYSILSHNLNEDNLFEGFDDWVARYFKWKESTSGWKNIILKECNNDEIMSVDRFFELYDEFKIKKNRN